MTKALASARETALSMKRAPAATRASRELAEDIGDRVRCAEAINTASTMSWARKNPTSSWRCYRMLGNETMRQKISSTPKS